MAFNFNLKKNQPTLQGKKKIKTAQKVVQLQVSPFLTQARVLPTEAATFLGVLISFCDSLCKPV